MDDQLDFVLNPTFALRIVSSARRRDAPASEIELSGATDKRFVEWYLSLIRHSSGNADASSVDMPDSIWEVALRTGLLVPADEVPDEAQEYRCDLDDSLVPFLSATELHLDDLCASRLRANTRIMIQNGIERPSGPRIPPLDERLWQHLGRDVARDQLPGICQSPQIFWVHNPLTDLYEPLWDGGTWGKALRSLIVDKTPLHALPPAALKLLRLSNVLLPTEGQPRGSGGLHATQEQLAERGFAILPSVLSSVQIAALRRHFRALRAAGWFRTDKDQVVGFRDGIYCESVCLFLQALLLPLIVSVTGTEIRPSYTWVQRYRPGARLARHVDREQCRWNVSFCIDIEGEETDVTPWSLMFADGAKSHGADLGIGDAVVYSGTQTEHWRDQLPEGKSVTVCLFHYVDARFDGSLR